jgi:hypothetical protein
LRVAQLRAVHARAPVAELRIALAERAREAGAEVLARAGSEMPARVVLRREALQRARSRR